DPERSDAQDFGHHRDNARNSGNGSTRQPLESRSNSTVLSSPAHLTLATARAPRSSTLTTCTGSRYSQTKLDPAPSARWFLSSSEAIARGSETSSSALDQAARIMLGSSAVGS